MGRSALILLLFSLLGSPVFSQNLVPNPSFETYSACPTSSSQLTNATPWNNAKNSPEYLNLCSSSIYSDVPSSFFGFQNANTGQAYGGGICYGSFASSYLADLREYLYVPLTTPLTIGQTYYLSFYTNLVDNSEYAVNRVGMQFCTGLNSNFPINNIAHLSSAAVISDKVNWTNVTGSFVATSAFNAVMLGNFFTDANTTVTFVGSSVDIGYNAYYIFDDVYVSTTPLTLPIKWGNLKAEVNGRLATLHWDCEAEAIDHFVIESSEDGSSFVDGQVVEAFEGQYTYAQVDTMGSYLPTTYYRIRAVEVDGSQHLSQVVEANLYSAEIDFLLAYPSVVSQGDELTVEFNTTRNEAISLKFFALDGKLVRTEEISSGSIGHQQLRLPMEDLQPGAYILKAGSLTQRIMVVR